MQQLARPSFCIFERKGKAELQSCCFHCAAATVAVATGGCSAGWHPDGHRPLKLVCGAPWKEKERLKKKIEVIIFLACLFDSSQKHSLARAGVRTVPLKSTHCCSQQKSCAFYVTPLASTVAVKLPAEPRAEGLFSSLDHHSSINWKWSLRAPRTTSFK